MKVATYYVIGNYTSFAISNNYTSFCEIYDQDKEVIISHPLSDVYWGKWRKTASLLKKWRKDVEKAGLIPIPIS